MCSPARAKGYDYHASGSESRSGDRDRDRPTVAQAWNGPGPESRVTGVSLSEMVLGSRLDRTGGLALFSELLTRLVLIPPASCRGGERRRRRAAAPGAAKHRDCRRDRGAMSE